MLWFGFALDCLEMNDKSPEQIHDNEKERMADALAALFFVGSGTERDPKRADSGLDIFGFPSRGMNRRRTERKITLGLVCTNPPKLRSNTS